MQRRVRRPGRFCAPHVLDELHPADRGTLAEQQRGEKSLLPSRSQAQQNPLPPDSQRTEYHDAKQLPGSIVHFEAPRLHRPTAFIASSPAMNDKRPLPGPAALLGSAARRPWQLHSPVWTLAAAAPGTRLADADGFLAGPGRPLMTASPAKDASS